MKRTYLFIGAGRMAAAMVKGLKASCDDQVTIYAANSGNKERLEIFCTAYQLFPVVENWTDYITKVDTIVLAMPPSQQQDILQQLAPFVTTQLIISVAAGKGLREMQKYLPDQTAVAWVMPNTAAQIGQSMSLYTTSTISEAQKSALHVLLESIGEAKECSEEQIHTLTAITGSAPAFVYEFAMSLMDAAGNAQLAEEELQELVAQMIYGAAMMLKSSSSPAELREAVTTPGGATAAGLDVLYAKNFQKVIHEAIQATSERARILGN
ncbi:pyrroline-5-carboxylate reductase [Fictibacillus macauensis ZFHKF-1]|uniref:Pyrroline-5-carboxylate reductase n=1 Tax=Fictibacillus macauensis ZFHKF-1 TaxID=1196324 RepID=I8AN22_9BACL|nr:pyrroline-5-carboxylate reductase [Fictibacillus macauensis]EIT87119.1 pyrroline-5-carboxylate reductase [Fictibacillus macauensis ZFHKF-1]